MEPTATDPTDRIAVWLGVIIAALREAVAAHGPKMPGRVPMIVLAWRRLGRIVREFDRLLASRRVGQLPSAQRAVVRPRPATTEVVTNQRAGAAPRLPTGHGWLIRLAPGTVPLRFQVDAWLADPEVIALLQASPQARRLLRPLCRMLALKPGPALALPPRPTVSTDTIPAGLEPAASETGAPKPSAGQRRRRKARDTATGWTDWVPSFGGLCPRSRPTRARSGFADRFT